MSSASGQMALPLVSKVPPSLEHFLITPDNAAAVSAARSCASSQACGVYVWGPASSGRTHLLASVLALQPRSAYFSFQAEHVAGSEPHVLERDVRLWCWDDVEGAAGHRVWEEALFHAYNRLVMQGGSVLIAASQPPRRVPWCLPDWGSRVAQTAVFQLHKLSDAQQLQALQLQAQARGLSLPDPVGQFMLKRCARDMHTLVTVLETLDKAALRAQRKLTVPFVKHVLRV